MLPFSPQTVLDVHRYVSAADRIPLSRATRLTPGGPALALLLATLLFATPCAASDPVSEPAEVTDPLRVLMLRAHSANHAHRDSAFELQSLRRFAADHDRPLIPVHVYRPEELYTALVGGRGDIVIGSLPPGFAERDGVIGTEVLDVEQFVVVGQRGSAVANPLDLRYQRIGVRHSSPMWPYLERLQATLEGINLEALPDDLSQTDVLGLIADGKYDLTIIATDQNNDQVDAFPSLDILFPLTPPEPVSWYVRTSDEVLRDDLNEHLRRHHAARLKPRVRYEDLAALQDRRVLRVITRPDAQNYFIYKGSPSGFEYELLRRFAATHHLRTEFLLAESDEAMLDLLSKGYGDIISARVDPELLAQHSSITTSRPYHQAVATLITRGDLPLNTIEDLNERTTVTRAGSFDERLLRELAGAGIDVRVTAVPETTSIEQVLALVARGDFDATLVDALYADDLLAQHSELGAGPELVHRFDYRWSMRRDSPQLARAVEEFLHQEVNSAFFNLLRRRYLESPRLVRAAASAESITPFDGLIRDSADRHAFDWRLIAALIYQESRFDADAVSVSGAVGLMQLMPATAASIGVDKPRDPASAIEAGVRYLAELRGQFGDGIPVTERIWFALAAYNAGPGRVQRARRLAGQLGFDPNRWFDHVEQAMRKLALPHYQDIYQDKCKCGQAVVYVREIQSLYLAYQQHRNLPLAGISRIPSTAATDLRAPADPAI